MGKKKNNDVQSENNAYFERIKVLENAIESYRADGEKLGDEILALRRSVSSYKGANTKLTTEVKDLKAIIEKQKQLNLEADELNEQSIAEKSRLRGMVDKMGCTIDGLNAQVSELTDKVSEKQKAIDDLNVEVENLTKALEFEQMPWWKKIF